MKRLAWLLALAACLWAAPAASASEKEEPALVTSAGEAPAASASEEEKSAASASEHKKSAASAEGEAPAASASDNKGNKERLRQLSEAFKDFKPSEEISADNAVPFPADI